MSWDQISTETKPCPCGQGTVTITTEMDDWNRYRESKSLACPTCQAAQRALDLAAETHRTMTAACKTQARDLATRRYAVQWLALFDGKSKKASHVILYAGADYPALGTFYKHVGDAGGLKQYLTEYFDRDFEAALHQLRVNDPEIAALLEQSRLPCP